MDQGIIRKGDLLQHLSETVRNLKNLVMSPQEFWNRHDITTATDAVTNARAQLQDTAAASVAQSTAAQAAAVKALQASDERAKALADARKMAQIEADQAVAPHIVTQVQADQAVAHTVTQVEAVPVTTVAPFVITITPEAIMVWTTATTVEFADGALETGGLVA